MLKKQKQEKKNVSKPKEDVSKPFTSSSSISSAVSHGLVHQRGLVNNELQQPTIIQQIQSIPDPRIDKLEKRTKKIKDYLKDKGDTKDNAINVNSPKFQDAFDTPSGLQSARVKPETMTPKILNFAEVTKPKSILGKLFSFRKKKVPATELTKRTQDPFKDAIESPLLLEYKPSKPSPNAPSFIEVQSSTMDTQTTPLKNGIETEKELKNLVNQLLHSHPHSKIHHGTFRSAIAKKLKELGYDTRDTNVWTEKMRRFYDQIFAESQGTEAAGGVM